MSCLSLSRDLPPFPFSPQTSLLCSSYVIHVTVSASLCFSHHPSPQQTNSTSYPNFQFPRSHLIYLRQLFSPAVCCHPTEELAASGQVARPGLVPGPGSQGTSGALGKGISLLLNSCAYVTLLSPWRPFDGSSPTGMCRLRPSTSKAIAWAPTARRWLSWQAASKISPAPSSSSCRAFVKLISGSLISQNALMLSHPTVFCMSLDITMKTSGLSVQA